MNSQVVGSGVAKLPAGSCTAVGGHVEQNAKAGQAISDERAVAEMKAAIGQPGFQPAMKDWQPLKRGK